MLGPCFGHIRAMFWLFLQWLCFQMPEITQIFTEELCMTSREYSLMLTYWDHVWAILGPCFGYFYNTFASRCFKWFKISLESHAYQIEEYHSMLNYRDHIRAMFLLFLQYLCYQMPEMANNFTKESCMPNREYSLLLTYWNLLRAMSKSY